MRLAVKQLSYRQWVKKKRYCDAVKRERGKENSAGKIGKRTVEDRIVRE